ncbi:MULTISPECIES: fimbrial protein [Pantoea]|uniref:fimbrial protein n=1 Tax=Pantoea TaxID=53335 RepID=UPI001F3D278E|nr:MULTISPECIES: fimbrial protein [Pantoea]UIL51498.1 fimbrial protein [Pantoea agglomerans]
MTDDIATMREKRVMPGLVLLLWLTVAGPSQALENNLQISGTLVTEPCTLDVNNNTQTVDFGTVIEKGLYKDVRTPGVPFTISLTECDISLGKTVSLTLTGAESTPLPGYLTATGSGSAGVAIGIETPEGKNLPVNQAMTGFALNDGTTEIVLQAYVQAEPDAIKNQSLVPGAFSATATIDAEYP